MSLTLPVVDESGPVRDGARTVLNVYMGVVDVTDEIASTWAGLSTTYSTPEAPDVLEAMTHPGTCARTLAADAGGACAALLAYADRLDELKTLREQLTADIAELKGRWQKQALAGHGQMNMDGSQYHIKALEIKIGDNRVALDGKLDDKTLALDFDLDGKRLAAFHPALGGSLTGKGKLTGSRQAPELQAQLSGKALTYAGHKIASLQADLATSLKKGGRFNNRIQLQGVQTAGQNWKDIQLASDGNYDRHSLTLRTSGGDANLQLLSLIHI